MPTLISIAVESPERYIAIDSDGRVWGGQAFTKPGGPIVIKWEPIDSEFPASSEPAKLWGGPPTADDECTCAPGYGANPKCPQHGLKKEA